MSIETFEIANRRHNLYFAHQEMLNMLPHLWITERSAPRQLAEGKLTEAEVEDIKQLVDMCESGITLFNPDWWDELDIETDIFQEPKAWAEATLELKQKAAEVGADRQRVTDAKLRFLMEINTSTELAIERFRNNFGEPIELPSFEMSNYIDQETALIFGLKGDCDDITNYLKSIEAPFNQIAGAIHGIEAGLVGAAKEQDISMKRARIAIIAKVFLSSYEVDPIIEQAIAYADDPASAPDFPAACESFIKDRLAEIEESEPERSIEYAAAALEFDRKVAAYEAMTTIGYDPDNIPEVVFPPVWPK